MDLKFFSKHNTCAYLNKTDPEATDYHQMIDFLSRSRIYHAITVNPTVYENHICAFWDTAAVSQDANVPTIQAVVDGKDVIITEDTIRQVLQFNDAPDSPTEFPQQLIVDTFDRMGYEGDYSKKQVIKTLLSPNWRFLVHICIHCLSSRKGGFDAANSTLSSAVVSLVLNRPYNFSKLIFNELLVNIRGVKKDKFLMYPRFLQQILNVQLQNLTLNGNTFQFDHMKKSVYNYMKSIHKKSPFTGTITPLFGHIIGDDQEVVNEDENVSVHDDKEVDDEGNDVHESGNEAKSDSEATQTVDISELRSKERYDGTPPSTSASHQRKDKRKAADEEHAQPLKIKSTVRKSTQIRIQSDPCSPPQQQQQQQHESQHLVEKEEFVALNKPPQDSRAPVTSKGPHDKPYDPNHDSMLPQPFVQLRVQVCDLQKQLAAKDIEIANLNLTVADQAEDLQNLRHIVSDQQATLERLSKVVDSLVSHSHLQNLRHTVSDQQATLERLSKVVDSLVCHSKLSLDAPSTSGTQYATKKGEIQSDVQVQDVQTQREASVQAQGGTTAVHGDLIQTQVTETNVIIVHDQGESSEKAKGKQLAVVINM